MLPIRELLKAGTRFQWTDELNHLFEESKAIIVSEIHQGVEIFDKAKPTCHGLEQRWHWLLAFSKALCLPILAAILLQNWMENHTGWKQIPVGG